MLSSFKVMSDNSRDYRYSLRAYKSIWSWPFWKLFPFCSFHTTSTVWVCHHLNSFQSWSKSDIYHCNTKRPIHC